MNTNGHLLIILWKIQNKIFPNKTISKNQGHNTNFVVLQLKSLKQNKTTAVDLLPLFCLFVCFHPKINLIKWLSAYINCTYTMNLTFSLPTHFELRQFARFITFWAWVYTSLPVHIRVGIGIYERLNRFLSESIYTDVCVCVCVYICSLCLNINFSLKLHFQVSTVQQFYMQRKIFCCFFN